ncbi:uncharacterized protein [Rhodnius prolixus]|uniref:C2H2-type domain-containing protein n=1 Tax=Rhodnius prolixus TaxID=13249 RepID=T1HQJ8_RHOPR
MEGTMTTATTINKQRTVDLFLRVSSFTRYLLDDVLPAEICNKQNVHSGMLDELSVACEDLNSSLQMFKQLTSLQCSDSITSASQGNESLSNSLQVDEHALKFSMLCEDTKSKLVSLPDIIKFKPYYCKICNLATSFELDFNRHCSTKKHITQINQISGPLTVYKCKKCHLMLLAPVTEVSQIISIAAHNLLDEHISKLKRNNDKTCNKSSTNNPPSKDGDICVTSDSSYKEDIADDNYLPQKVKQLFNVIKRGFKSGAHLVDDIPHYCNVCDVGVTSVDKFIDHTSSKEHISAVNSSTKLIAVFKCEICGFLITGYETDVDELKNSNCHKNFDEFITHLKVYDKNQDKCISKVKAGADTTNLSNFLEESPLQTLTLDMLKKSINSLLEILRLPTDLKKYASCCCFMCRKVFSSSNDFKQHILSRKHITVISSFSDNFFVHYCPLCSLSIYGTENDIRNALETTEHNNLHKRINDLFYSNNEEASDPQVCNPVKGMTSVSSVSNKAVGFCKKDSKKLVMSNDEKQLPEKNSASKMENQSKTFNHQITDKFLTVNGKLQCGDFSKSGFCRPCKKAVNITKGWAHHLKCSKHQKIMSKQEFENIPLQCEYCSLQILGDQVHGNPCMAVHLKLNHPNMEKHNVEKEFLVVDAADEISESCSGISSSQSKSTETVGSNNFLEINTALRTSDLQLSPVNLSVIEHNKQLITNESSSKKNEGDCLDIFKEFLSKRKNLFINEGLKKFGGMCLICVQTYDDFFEWLVHLKEPRHKLAKQLDCIEKECKDCNLSLFGKKANVENEFWYLKEHISLDILVTQ